MVAGVNTAVVLHRDAFAAEFVLDTILRRQPQVLCHHGLKMIDQHLAQIAAPPFIEYLAEKVESNQGQTTYNYERLCVSVVSLIFLQPTDF